MSFCQWSGRKACRLDGRHGFSCREACYQQKVWFVECGGEALRSLVFMPCYPARPSCYLLSATVPRVEEGFSTAVFMVHGLSHPQPETLDYTVVLDLGRQGGLWTWESDRLATVVMDRIQSRSCVSSTPRLVASLWMCLLGARWGRGTSAGLWGALAACLPSGGLVCYLQQESVLCPRSSFH